MRRRINKNASAVSPSHDREPLYRYPVASAAVINDPRARARINSRDSKIARDFSKARRCRHVVAALHGGAPRNIFGAT